MNLYIPVPYPDELLYSVIARYLIYTQGNRGRQIRRNVLTQMLTTSLGLPVSVSQLANRTNIIWRMTPGEIIGKLTLWPFFSRYYPRSRLNKIQMKYYSDNGRLDNARFLFRLFAINDMRYLRYCRVCRAEDIDKYKETYWHRSHQIPGIVVCPYHGVPLAKTTLSMRHGLSATYYDATCWGDGSDMEYDDLSSEELVKAHAVARRCREMLQGSIIQWPEIDASVRYRQAALERCFTDKLLCINWDRLAKAFVEFYGHKLLSMWKCKVRSNHENWFKGIFNSRSTFNPVRHAVVQIFLENSRIEFSRAMTLGYGPWKCPNPLSHHNELYSIRQIRIYRGGHGKIVGSAKCSCGYCFTFYRISDSDPHMPIVHRVNGRGRDWEVEVKRLKNEKMTIKSIAKYLNISPAVTMRLLHSEPTKKNKIQACVRQWREEFTALVEKAPNRSRTLASKLNKRLYSNLLRHDRAWLKAIPRACSRMAEDRL